MSDEVMNFQRGQFFVGSIDQETKTITLREDKHRERSVTITAEELRAHMLGCQQKSKFSQPAFELLAKSLGLLD